AGVVETLLPLSLGWVGIALAPAVLAVVGYRVINLWLPLIPAVAGLPMLQRLGHRRTRAGVGRHPFPRLRDPSDGDYPSVIADVIHGRCLVLWILVLLLLLFALGGGIFVSKFLFLVLLVALIVALLGRGSTV